MQDVAPIAFVAEPRPGAALEVRVNFGIFARRRVTNAEIDDLAGLLLPELAEVSIVAEDRHEFDREVEVSLHQVRIEVGGDALAEGASIDELGGRITAIAEHWAESCFAGRRVGDD